MSYVNKLIDDLIAQGIYAARKVDTETIQRIINMDEWEYYALEIQQIEAYLGLLAQHVCHVQQQCNIAEAREIELGTDFKISALPEVVATKIRSVEERWIFASQVSPELNEKFNRWQQAVTAVALNKHMAEPYIEKLNVLKKIYDDRRLEGRNRNLHKYTDGGS